MKFPAMLGLAGMLVSAAMSPAQQYVFRAYRQADGLKNLAARTLARDCEGYLWVGTENGVFRFLGSSFEHFGREQGIAELGIQEIIADRACNVWVGTTRNVYRLNGREFVPALQSPIRILNPHGMAAADEHNLLVVDNGRLFRLEHGGNGQGDYRSVFSAAALKAIPELRSVYSVSVVADSGGGSRIWIGAGGKLFSWLKPEKRVGAKADETQVDAMTVWDQQKGLSNDHWDSVVVDGAGTVWAEGWSHIEALPAGAGRFADHSIPVAAQGNFFLRSRMVVDKQGRVLAPADAGIVRWEQDHWHAIDHDSGLPRNNQIGSMLFDGNGDLWLGSWGDGLYNWSGYEQWEGWSDDRELPSPIIWAIDASHDRVLVGTDKGPARIDPQTGAAGALARGRVWTPGLIVAMGREQDGAEWAATNSGSILRMSGGSMAPVATAKLPASIVSGFEDSSGHLFLGTDQGVYERDTVTATPRRVTAADGLIEPGNWVDGGCQAPDGTDWFLSGDRLLSLKGGQWSKPVIDGMPGLDRGKLVSLACSDDGELWATGPRIGTWRLLQVGSRVRAENLHAPEALGGIDSYVILADRRGWIWLGTGQGLLAWNGSAWRHLTEESGLLWNDVDEWGLSEAADGSLWVGTSGGLAHLLHPERVFNPVKVPVFITGAQRGDQDLDVTPEINLSWSPQPLRLQLTSPLVRNRSELVFKYQVEGLHSGWIESGDGLAVLSGLSAGSYTFMAMASNPGLNADSGIVKLKFVIRPPWWRLKWVLAMAGLALVLLAVMGVRLYARHLRARSRHLEELVQQRTRELEASREQLRVQAMYDGLTGMLNRSSILNELATQMEAAQQDGKPLILALLDVDHFKEVNDRHGHLAGDEALRRFSGALRVAIRAFDRVGRYGGEEFLLLLTDVPPDLAESRLEHLHAGISNLRVRVGEAEIRITCSIGGTVFDPQDESVDSERLLSLADEALYAAKAEGRDRVVMRRTNAAGLANVVGRDT